MRPREATLGLLDQDVAGVLVDDVDVFALELTVRVRVRVRGSVWVWVRVRVRIWDWVRVSGVLIDDM